MYEPVANNYVSIMSQFNHHDDFPITPIPTQLRTTTVPSDNELLSQQQHTDHINILNQQQQLKPPEKPPRRNKLHKMQKQADSQNNSYISEMDHRIEFDNIKPTTASQEIKYLTVGVQVTQIPPYRLRVLPKRCCTFRRKSKGDSEELCWEYCSCRRQRVLLCCKSLGRWMFSQCGLVVIIVIWALLGAAAFHETEGPREREQAEELATLQYNLAISLATELRQVVPHEPMWLSMVQKYFAKHETLLLDAVSAGYGEGGGGGQIWTYPGCLLFAVSLLTTLGFGAPVPRTTLGRVAAVLFSAIGIPLHFLLVLNVGVLIASKLQTWVTKSSTAINSKQPRWFKWLPFVAVIIYYLLGVILFGFVRQRNITDSLLFPLDFTATGGVAKTFGHVRIFYALYLEIAVTLAAVIVALLQVSASHGLVKLGLKLGLLTNA